MVDIPNYYERCVSLLASQFQVPTQDGSRTNLQKLIYSIVQQAQEFQTQENNLINLRSLEKAQGVQLDGIGQIVGLSRIPGQPDDSETIDGIYVIGYREALQFQIFANGVSGTPEEMMYILKFLTHASKVWLWEIYPAAYLMATDGLIFPENPSDLTAGIQQSTCAGVKFAGVTATYGGLPFVFSNDPINEQLYVAPNPLNPLELHPFQVDGGSGASDFFIQRGETTDPDFGGGFAEAIWVNFPTTPEVYQYDNTGAGQLTEFIEQ